MSGLGYFLALKILSGQLRKVMDWEIHMGYRYGLPQVQVQVGNFPSVRKGGCGFFLSLQFSSTIFLCDLSQVKLISIDQIV